MPDDTAAPFILSLKMHVAIGPVTAAASVGAIQILGFFTIFPIWSMDVPIPCEIRPPQRFSLNEMAAKPII